MRTIKTTGRHSASSSTATCSPSSRPISRDLARRQELDYGFEDVDREFAAPRRSR